MKVLVAFLGLVAICQAKSYIGDQVLKVAKDGLGQVEKFISENGLNVWSGNLTHLDVQVPKLKLPSFKQVISKAQSAFGVMIPDLAAAIETGKLPAQTASRAGGDNSKMNWDQYQRLNVIHDYLIQLAKTHDFVKWGIIGLSHEKREMRYIKISSGKPNAKVVFIDGGIHAREWISPAVVTYIIKELVENRSKLPKDLLDLDFYILPVLNPDGYEYTHTTDRMWRKNRSPEKGDCKGADLNRNFDFEFGGKGTSGSACSETYRGQSAGSEPETQAMVKFFKYISKNLKAYITFHNYGQYILVPYGYDNNKFAPNFEDMKAVGDRAAAAMVASGGEKYTVGNTANTLYPAAGGSDDWVKAKLPGVKYAYCIELRDKGDYGFLLPAKYIIPTGKEAFEAVKVIASAAAKA